jgi:hypothetical protein
MKDRNRIALTLRPVPLAWLALLGCLACGGEGTPSPYSIRVVVSPTPPGVGPARALVLITDPDGAPVSGLGVTLAARPVDGPASEPPMPAAETEPGTYVVDVVRFSSAGDWALVASVTDDQGRGASVEHRVLVVRGPS